MKSFQNSISVSDFLFQIYVMYLAVENLFLKILYQFVYICIDIYIYIYIYIYILF